MAAAEARLLKRADANEGRILSLLERKLDEILAATRATADCMQALAAKLDPQVIEARRQDAVLLPSPKGQGGQ